ncbi:hypothetical protein [Kocuria carniphila]|uniref:hypothetical protein n=1 Tax=Kocuria carniphila TaxID=262208 RepID=UPI0034DB007B
MTTVSLERVGSSELQQERERLLRQSGISYEELRRRHESYNLTVEQRNIADQIEEVDFLLQE